MQAQLTAPVSRRNSRSSRRSRIFRCGPIPSTKAVAALVVVPDAVLVEHRRTEIPQERHQQQVRMEILTEPHQRQETARPAERRVQDAVADPQTMGV
jgi:hypothetical protein